MSNNPVEVQLGLTLNEQKDSNPPVQSPHEQEHGDTPVYCRLVDALIFLLLVCMRRSNMQKKKNKTKKTAKHEETKGDEKREAIEEKGIETTNEELSNDKIDKRIRSLIGRRNKIETRKVEEWEIKGWTEKIKKMKDSMKAIIAFQKEKERSKSSDHIAMETKTSNFRKSLQQCKEMWKMVETLQTDIEWEAFEEWAKESRYLFVKITLPPFFFFFKKKNYYYP
ncbi:hypothetical protein RFI_18862 [Reticulomyxa filosa]|uniref:Uncharacterized protein n=1 Tax=Reticulomyxa filosa TaxID=46433 RepID=X6MX80_RETFI|nr:hypothetical protein RFI_18862 [Reticulomyxa filosa]|eukprot:ETO18404.1 hypothetical protein RFI_18862 [Reticulomyxa filosa]